jgi:hypothetical protein
MQSRLLMCAAAALAAGVWAAGPQVRTEAAGKAADKTANTLVYADFENNEDGKPVSSRGGKVSLWGYQESPTRMSVFKGHEADNSVPKLVRTSRTDDNHAAAFDYELVIPNEWAGVTMEVQGGPADDAGKLPADDVSGFKFMSVQAYVTGTHYIRTEILSHGSGINLHSGYPVTGFKLKDGFNTYKVPLRSYSQPQWVQGTRIDPRQVLRNLTSVTFSVYCEQQCRPASGTVVIDNIVFEK